MIINVQTESKENLGVDVAARLVKAWEAKPRGTHYVYDLERAKDDENIEFMHKVYLRSRDLSPRLPTTCPSRGVCIHL